MLKEIEESKNKAWIKSDNKARNIIIQSIENSHLEYVKDLERVTEMLKKLETIFAK